MNKKNDSEGLMKFLNVLGVVIYILLFMVAIISGNILLAFIAFLGGLIQLIQYKKRGDIILKEKMKGEK